MPETAISDKKDTQKTIKISHKDIKKDLKWEDLDTIKNDVSKFFSYLNVKCDKCNYFYSYIDNVPCIMKCGISICQKCSKEEFNCKDCKSVKEKNLPTNMYNKDLNKNNSLIIIAKQQITQYTDAQRSIMNRQVSARRFDLPKLDYEYQIDLKDGLPSDGDYDAKLEVFEDYYHGMPNCVSFIKSLRLRIETVINDTKLNSQITDIKGEIRALPNLLDETENFLFEGFSRFKTSHNFQAIMKLSDFMFPESFLSEGVGHIFCFSYSKKQKKKFNRVIFDGDFILLDQCSDSICSTNQNVFIFDKESLQLQFLPTGIFFTIHNEKNYVNVPLVLNFQTLIAKQIISFCCPEATPSFNWGEVRVSNEETLINLRLNNHVKYWCNVDELCYKAIEKGDLTLSQTDELNISLKLHRKSSDKWDYIFSHAIPYFSTLEIGNYPIVSLGVLYDPGTKESCL